jgi:hypothetical protein
VSRVTYRESQGLTGLKISRSRSHSDRPAPPKHRSPLVHHLVRDPPSSAAPGLGEPMSGWPIVTTGPSRMNQVGCHLATSEMRLPIAVEETTIAHRDRLLLGHFEDIEMGIGHAREPRKDSIVASEGAPVHVLHDPLTPEIDGITVSARDRVVSMKVKRICQCHDEVSEMCLRCRFLCWKNLIGMTV